MSLGSSNRSNTELGFHMIGGSAIWSPTGEPLPRASPVMTSDVDMGETTWHTAEIDPAAYDNTNKARLSSRRPKLYQNLLLHIGPWDYMATSEPLWHHSRRWLRMVGTTSKSSLTPAERIITKHL